MTPERALQIASAALDAPERTAQCFLNAILAACAEERKAALTEAAEAVERERAAYDCERYSHVAAILFDVRALLEELRDRA